ncbi:hypothetical protein ABT097_07425 [Streptomyces sp. NPDC002225]|uniref:hypothetical protein n=1 Tax=Streptomyces sp. NPDC002225 TaxID=3154413 RepID=UPI00331C8855
MDAAELAAAAVGRFLAVVAGAVGNAFGQSGGDAVAEIVRARLGGNPRGESALRGLESEPGDTGARNEAENALREQIDTDPELRRQLSAHLSSPSVHHHGSVVISGSRVSRGHLSFGPLTINNTPAARILIGVSLLLTAGLLVLAVHGGQRLLISQSPATQKSQGAGSRAASMGPHVLPTSEADRALLTADDMPRGWVTFDVDTYGEEDRQDGCELDGIEFERDGDTPHSPFVDAAFIIHVCSSYEVAKDVFQQTARQATEQQMNVGTPTKLDLPRFGDEYSTNWYKSSDVVYTTVRVENVVLGLRYKPYTASKRHKAEIVELTRRAVERIRSLEPR